MKKLMLISTMSLMTMSFLTSCDNKNQENLNNSDMDMDSTPVIMDEPIDTMETSMAQPELENTDMVASGTYSGTAKQVDAAEREIYVETADGKTLELYFTDATKITKNGTNATFEDLKQGGKIEVTVENKGESLEPVSVNIMD